MKKALKSLAVSACLILTIFALAACGSSGSSNSSSSKKSTSDSNTKTETPAILKQTDTGNGSMYIETADGTSENGNVPKILLEGDESVLQIGFAAQNFDSSKFTYFYVDGKLSTKEQIGADLTEGSLDLSGDALSEGKHTVQAVQYDSSDESGNVTACHSAQYEVSK